MFDALHTVSTGTTASPPGIGSRGDVPAARLEEPKELVAKAVRRSRERLAQRQARYEEVARLHAQGLSVAAIAQALGMGLNSVWRWLRAGHAPLWRKPPRPKLLDRYQAYLERRWLEGCRRGTTLWRDLQARAFPVGAAWCATGSASSGGVRWARRR